MRQSAKLAQSLLLGEWTPREQKQKLFWLLAQRLKRTADACLYIFIKNVLGYSDLALEPHWEMCQFIQRNLWEDILILTPRGSFKSTVTSVGLPLWLFTKDRDLRILLTSYEMDYTKNWLDAGKRHISTNRTFRLLYGNLRPEGRSDEKWSATRISLSGRKLYRAENSWTASSIRSSETSQHYDIAIVDDPVNELITRNQELMDQVTQNISVLVPLLDPFTRKRVGRSTPWRKDPGLRGPRILVGTRWHFADPWGKLLADERERKRNGEPPELKVLVRRIRRKGKDWAKKKLYFPSRFNPALIRQIEKSMKPSLFSALYENDPLPDEARTYRLSDLGFFNERHCRMGEDIFPVPKELVKITLLDPSRGETDTAHPSAFVTVAIDTLQRIFVWEVIRERIIGNDAILEQLFEIRERHKPLKVGIESYQFQKGLFHSFKAMCRTRGMWFHIHALEGDTKRSKPMRIEDFASFSRTRGLFLRVRDGTDLTLKPEDLYYRLVPGQDILANEMLHFPLASSNDCIDALAWLPRLIVPARSTPIRPLHADAGGRLIEQLTRRSQRGDSLELR